VSRGALFRRPAFSSVTQIIALHQYHVYTNNNNGPTREHHKAASHGRIYVLNC
jgi:hypothetical protein